MTENEEFTKEQSKTVSMELLVQSRADDDGPWTTQGDPYPAVFEEAARKYCALRRVAYPYLQTRLIERRMVAIDNVLDG